MANGPSHGGGKLVHALLVLDESQHQVAFLEGASFHPPAVIAAESLLVDGGACSSEVTCLIELIDSILAGEFIHSLRVVDDPWRVVLEVGGHDCLGAVHHEEGGEPCRPIDRGADAPDDGG